jgi:hypothetical protein
MKSGCFSFCFAVLLLIGCDKQPAIPKAIQGIYALSPTSRAYTGETFRLGDGVFAYVWFTDVLSDQQLKENPQCGHFSLAGSDVTLVFSDGHTTHLMLTKSSGGYMLWTHDEYKDYLRTKKVPFSVLYQQPKH